MSQSLVKNFIVKNKDFDIDGRYSSLNQKENLKVHSLLQKNKKEKATNRYLYFSK